MAGRLLPYVEGLLAGYLRTALATAYPGLMVATVYPAVSQRSYPLVLLTRAGGAASVPGYLDEPTVDIQAWTTDSKRGAAGITEAVRRAVYTAWREQIVTPEGHIVAYREVSGPAPLPSDDTTAPWRYQLLVSLVVRPPQA